MSEEASTLADLRVGERARLGRPRRLDATTLRLMEMGITDGVWIEVSRRAPWGDPIEIQVRRTRLCLRQVDAAVFPVLERAPAPGESP
jgi:Fe2+ transport system protein FeoA